MNEEWMEVPEFPRTEVSNMGNIRTKIVNTMQTYKKIIGGYGIPATPIVNGYKRVHLHHNGKIRKIHVHRLVAEVFLGAPKGGMVVNHKDSDRLNNSVENLEWVTQRENVNHYIRNHGLSHVARGARTGSSKIDVFKALAILTLSGRNQRIVGEALGCTQSNVSAIQLRKQWGDESISMELLREIKEEAMLAAEQE